MTNIAVILAGGHGERFWPLSRSSKPKQFLKLFSEHSMIKQTYLRILSFIPKDQIFIATNLQYKEKIASELQDLNPDNFIIEPATRDTAPAIALCSAYIEKKFPGAIMAIFPVDHIINDHHMLIQSIDNAYQIAKSTSCIITIGIQPSRVETSYGYIEIGYEISQESGTNAYEVKQFIEKPQYSKANQYIQSGNYLWNSGIYIFETQTFLEELSKYLPEIYSATLEIADSIGHYNEESVKEKLFENFPKISIDYGIMEKSRNILCIKGSFQWDDISTWSSTYRCLNSDENNNIISGQVISIDTSDTIILGDKNTLIGAVGLKDLVIIKTPDAILICNKNNEHKLKELIKSISEEENYKNFL